MRIEKSVSNNALRVLGKVVCQTSPAQEFRTFSVGHTAKNALQIFYPQCVFY